IRLDLKSAEGHAAFMRLAETADVVVENMRPAVKQRLRVAWDDVRAVNPRIIYGSISGFGQDGTYGHRAGVHKIAQGMGGVLYSRCGSRTLRQRTHDRHSDGGLSGQRRVHQHRRQRRAQVAEVW